MNQLNSNRGHKPNLALAYSQSCYTSSELTFYTILCKLYFSENLKQYTSHWQPQYTDFYILPHKPFNLHVKQYTSSHLFANSWHKLHYSWQAIALLSMSCFRLSFKWVCFQIVWIWIFCTRFHSIFSNLFYLFIL